MTQLRGALILFILLKFARHVTLATPDGDLEFKLDRGFQGFDLVCSVDNLKSTVLKNLDSLIISKKSLGSNKVLASVSSHYGKYDPISHVADAIVSGSLASGQVFKGYLRIHWPHPDSSLDGEYVCDVHGVDEDYVPQTESKALSVTIGSVCPCFGAEPEVVKVGLTEVLEITCFLPNLTLLGILELASLEIIRNRAGVRQIVAEINAISGPIIHQEADGSFVNGSLNKNVSFLSVKWDYPTAEIAAEYICEGSGASTSGNSMIFSRQLRVASEEPSKDELVERLMEIYKVQRELVQCKNELDNVANAVPSTAARATATQGISTTTAPTTPPQATPTTTSSTTRNTLPSRCEDLQLASGQYVVTLQPQDNLGPIQVLCEVVAPGDVWTVFQKRFNGTVDFYRNFSEYEQGFGSLSVEFWLGLAKLRRLLVQNGNWNRIKIELKELSSPQRYNLSYNNFYLGPADGYQLHADVKDDNSNGLSSNVGQIFSTYDHGFTSVASSSNRAAGWWFPESGGYVNINSKWGVVGRSDSMYWYQFRQSWMSPMEETVLKFQRMT